MKTRGLLMVLMILLYCFNNYAFAVEYVMEGDTRSTDSPYLVYALLDETSVYAITRWEKDLSPNRASQVLSELTDFRDRYLNDSMSSGSASNAEKVKIEGLIWYKGKTPTYWSNDNDRIKDFWENKKGYGPAKALAAGGAPMGPTYQHNPAGWDYGYRKGDQSKTMGRDTLCPVTEEWIHVWDTPEDALTHPADIELYINKPISLVEHLGVHYLVEPNGPYDEGASISASVRTWKHDADELRDLSLAWDFDIVDYFNSLNKTHDSRYITVHDHKTGLIEALNYSENGADYEDVTHTAVGREPLIRVCLYHTNHGKNKPILDGYIRVHVTRPELLEIDKYPTWNVTFDLCNDAQAGPTTWAQFSKWVLSDELHNMEKEQFDAAYNVEQEGAVDDVNKTMELVQYVKLNPTNEDKYYTYWKLTEAPATWAPTKSNKDEYKVGKIYTRFDEAGTTNHIYYWTITAKEMESLTQHMTDENSENGVTVIRYIHYTGHFYMSTDPNNAALRYDDIFIKLTLNLKKANPEPDPEVCAKPTIYYQNGQLSFKCATDGVEFVYDIKDDDVKEGTASEVDLFVTYTISVYAKRYGFVSSETATATLCWIDVEPQKEGITGDEDAVTEVKAMPVLIQSEGSGLTIDGAEAGTPIRVYDLSGKLIGNTTAAEGATRVNVAAAAEKVVVVKVGERSVKVRR